MSQPLQDDLKFEPKLEKAAEQMQCFKENMKEPGILTLSNGAAVAVHGSSLTIGKRGPMLMQDTVYLEEIQHFDRERIPERVVHAKGAGAYGYFEVTNDITQYTMAKVFAEDGKKTDVFVRLSTVIGERGSADTVRDPRGFAIKFYTEEGNWDLVGNNTPIFFVKDPIEFPMLIHAMKPNPRTHLRDPNALWDFVTQRPETVHQMMYMFGDRGIPDGFRHMNGYGSHTFKMINADGEAIWCKLHLKSKQGIQNLLSPQAEHLAGKDPDYAVRDLFNAIERGEYPEWDMYIQVMTFAQARTCTYNPFDLTKVWPHIDHPLIPVGKLVLNKNPCNYFAEVEQAAFSPSNLVPGIDVSPDKMLQGRIISYRDTQFHRIGPNFNELKVNCPLRAHISNYQIDGNMKTMNVDGCPTYHPNTFNGPVECPHAFEHHFNVVGEISRHFDHDEDNFTQPLALWAKVLDEGGKRRLVENIADSVKNCFPEIQERVVELFGQVAPDFKLMLIDQLKCKEVNFNSQMFKQKLVI